MAIFGAQDDPVKLAEVEEDIREAVTLANANDITLIQGANNRLQEASRVLSGQGASTETAELDAEQSAALSRAGT